MKLPLAEIAECLDDCLCDSAAVMDALPDHPYYKQERECLMEQIEKGRRLVDMLKDAAKAEGGCE